MIESQHSNVFKRKVVEHRVKLLELLATGLDKHTYRRLVGQIQGLDDAVKLSDDADYELSGE